ncbi:MAG: beta-hydroxyacyl-ACP dehydratase [Syntrophaceae bacterium]|nr:beta-hydroxyacyl-ACP dehydratase [Syntrophaceae bacterium]
MAADCATRERILGLVPQQPPFRFVDEILELDEEHVLGTYRFRENEYFYQGHFPGVPITPGVILVETMAQTGVVAFGLYLAEQDAKIDRLLEGVTLFSLADQVEFAGVVRPGEQVVISGRKVYFRNGQLKVACSMVRPDGEVVCSGTLAGMAISRAKFAETKNDREEAKG